MIFCYGFSPLEPLEKRRQNKNGIPHVEIDIEFLKAVFSFQ